MKLATNIHHVSRTAERFFKVRDQTLRLLDSIYGNFVNVMTLWLLWEF